MVHYSEYKPDKKKTKNNDDIIILNIKASTYYIKKGRIYYTKQEESKPQSTVYLWTISINETVYYGRSMEECGEMIEQIKKTAENVIIFCENLNYDFQYLRNVYDFSGNVFARDKRELITAKEENITFRCIKNLSGLNTSDLSGVYNLPHNYTKTTEKSEINPLTMLTEQELKNAEDEAMTLYDYIKYEKTNYKQIRYIPLTNTGKCRKAWIQYMEKHGGHGYVTAWKRSMAKLTETYKMRSLIKSLLQGGYVFSKADGDTFINVGNNDAKSFYPSIMLSRPLPYEKFTECDPTEEMDTEHAYIIILEAANVEAVKPFLTIDNKNIRKCDRERVIAKGSKISSIGGKCTLIFTDLDFYTFKRHYKYTYLNIKKMYKAKTHLIPKMYADFILECYNEKEKAKAEYKKDPSDINKRRLELAKIKLNAIFGMNLTDYFKPQAELMHDEWKQDYLTAKKYNEKLEELKKSESINFVESWGVWITAWARYILLQLIDKIDKYVLYTDTDSIYYFECDKVKEIIEDFNLSLEHDIKTSYLTQGHLVGLLGQFVYEHHHDKFKALHVKSYASERDGKLYMTVAGLNKSAVYQLNNDINNFKDGFIFDKTDIKHITYNDEQTPAKIRDRDGVIYETQDTYGVCESESTFTLQGKPEDYKTDFYEIY